MINTVEELEQALREWSFNDNIPDDKIVEVPLSVIQQFAYKRNDENYLFYLESQREELDKRIKNMEKNVEYTAKQDLITDIGRLLPNGYEWQDGVAVKIKGFSR